MAEMMPSEGTMEYRSLAIPRRDLQALAGVEGLVAGALSPLARMRAAADGADPGELIAAFEGLDETWKWAVPALLDPHRAIALLVGDGSVNLIGQYIFPDAEARGPGFGMDISEEAVVLKGPVSLERLEESLHMSLMMEDVAYVEPVSFDLAEADFWALMACLDAYRTAILALRVVRAGGMPSGVGAEVVSKAWEDGVSKANPGWAVSLFALLAPDRVPQDLPGRLPGLLADMARKGLLREVPSSEGVLYSFHEAMTPLLRGLTMAVNFGLVTQRIIEPRAIEVAALGGWRTAGGIWMADLGELESRGAKFLLAGPDLAAGIIDDLLGFDALITSQGDFAMETPYARDVVVSRLRESGDKARMAAVTEAAPAQRSGAERTFCARCGDRLREGARFCRSCGAEVPREEVADAVTGRMSRICVSCGSEVAEDHSFCRQCGRPVEEARPSPALCDACGSTLLEGASFCRQCGKPVEGTRADRAICDACGSPLKEGASFCRQCGKPVGAARTDRAFCPACGNAVEVGLMFCNRCGERL